MWRKPLATRRFSWSQPSSRPTTRLKRPVSLSTKNSGENLLNFAAIHEVGSNHGARKSSCVLSGGWGTVRRPAYSERGLRAGSDFDIELIDRRGSFAAPVLFLSIRLILGAALRIALGGRLLLTAGR
jgi:hypothetical protein